MLSSTTERAPMASIVYRVRKPDIRHAHCGHYVDIDGCFDGPVGPFWSRQAGASWITENAGRLTELYGPGAGDVAPLPAEAS